MGKVIIGFLNPLFKYILNTISFEQTTQIKLHALSVMFQLIEQFPREAEEQNFSSQALQTVISQAVTRDTSVAVWYSLSTI